MKDKIYKMIDNLYKENIWVKESQYKNLLAKVQDENWDEARLVQGIESGSLKAKQEFKKICLRMGNKEQFFSISKKIFKVGIEEKIIIKCKYNFQRLSGNFKIVISPYYNYHYKIDNDFVPYTTEISAVNDEIVIPYVFENEDMYIVNVFYLLDGEELKFLSTNLYAVEEDLFDYNFYKADLHMHTTYSDGYEPPEMVAVTARQLGMDVIAITDHNNYEGSIVAQNAVKEMGMNMTVLRGEEYSLEYSPMHILGIGTEEAIEKKYKTKQIIELVDIPEEEFDSNRKNDENVSVLCIQKLLDEIRNKNGISILAHPFWKPIDIYGNRIDTSEKVFLELSKEKRFDGIELVSGSQDGECNVANMQAALAREMVGTFEGVPITGITDSHCYSSDPICGKHFTVIVSKTKSEEDIKQSLREGKCVAVEMCNGVPLCYGAYRYMKIAQYLVNNYFPDRDKEAYIEATLIKKEYLMR